MTTTFLNAKVSEVENKIPNASILVTTTVLNTNLNTTLNALELQKYKGADYVLNRKSKGAFNSEFKPLYTAFLKSIKLSKL